MSGGTISGAICRALKLGQPTGASGPIRDKPSKRRVCQRVDCPRNQKLPEGADHRGHRRAKRWRARSAPSAAAATRHRQPYVQVDGVGARLHNGLDTGIANDQSIAYGCARALRDVGASLAITYLNEKARPYAEPLAGALGAE